MIAAIINFCTNESRFIKTCIEQTRLFADQIVIPVCDHFFDGSPEKMEQLDQIYRSFPDCQFIQYPFILNKLPPQRLFFWHNLSRYVGMQQVDPAIDTILFIDADEIPDGKRMAEWLDTEEYSQYNAVKLLNYWYFREPIYQALSHQASVLLVRKRAINPDHVLNGAEREGIFDSIAEPKKHNCAGLDGEPMFHHYSWVRTKEEMIKKTSTFNHRNDRNWRSMIEKEFSGPFSGKDFVHGFSFKTVDCPFNLSFEPPQFEPISTSPASIKKIDFNIAFTLRLIEPLSQIRRCKNG